MTANINLMTTCGVAKHSCVPCKSSMYLKSRKKSRGTCTRWIRKLCHRIQYVQSVNHSYHKYIKTETQALKMEPKFHSIKRLIQKGSQNNKDIKPMMGEATYAKGYTHNTNTKAV